MKQQKANGGSKDYNNRINTNRAITNGTNSNGANTQGANTNRTTNNDSRASQNRVTSNVNINPEVVAKAFEKSPNTKTAAERSRILRERFFWSTPRIFADPAKPALPIHGAPVETVIRTGRHMPGVVVGMRTPTEVARLEKEVHTLRSQLLDRTWQCPYAECHAGPFKGNDPAAIDAHMRIEHNTLQCFLCDDVNTLLPYYDQDAIREHFVTHHAADVKDLAKPWTTLESSEQLNQKDLQDLRKYLSVNALDTVRKNKLMLFNFCDRCGRDQLRLNHPADRLHHDTVCKELGANSRSQKLQMMPLCKFCGKTRPKAAGSDHPAPCSCGHVPQDRFDPGRLCGTCGIQYDGQSPPFDRHYREIHQRWCAMHSGAMWDFCGFCGIGLEGLGDLTKREHVHWCSERPNKGPATCPFPSCTESLFNGEQAKRHVEVTHGNSRACPFCQDSFTRITPDEKQIHLALHLYNIGAAPTVPEEEVTVPPAQASQPASQQLNAVSELVKAPYMGKPLQPTPSPSPENAQLARGGKGNAVPPKRPVSKLGDIREDGSQLGSAWKGLSETTNGRGKSAHAEKDNELDDDAVAPIWRNAGENDADPPQRAKSPVWGLDDPKYTPPYEARCSRCFRAAGANATWIRVS